jgi:hypothetical protein
VTPEALIGAALRHESAAWPITVSSGFAARLLDAAAAHGVTQLLATAPAFCEWPESVRSAVLQGRREAAALEIVRQRALTRILAALGDAGVRTLLFKGSALAYTHYAQPWLRPRLDTDLLVALEDRARALAIIEHLGYEPATHFGGRLVTYQSPLKRVGPHGLIDGLDVHWRVANPQVFAHMFEFDELDRDAVPVPLPGAAARTPSAQHALLIACVHRVAHHANSDRLIWLYDIRLLLDRMAASELEQVVATAAAKGLQSILAAGVFHARELVGLGASGSGIDRLLEASADREAAIAEFLNDDRAKIDDLVSDLHALSGWRPRLRLIREHLLPPAAYMRRTYGFSSPVFLPLAYALRAVTGASKWFRPER